MSYEPSRPTSHERQSATDECRLSPVGQTPEQRRQARLQARSVSANDALAKAFQGALRELARRDHRALFVVRRTSRLSKVMSLVVGSAIARLLERPMRLILTNTTTRVIVGFSISLLIAFPLDFAVHRGGLDAAATPALICAIVAAAFAAAGGGWGLGPPALLFGLVLGWLLGKIAEAVTSSETQSHLDPWLGHITLWLTATLLGWIAGTLTEEVWLRILELRG